MWVAAGSYLNLVFGFIANLALTRLLAPHDFGVFALAMFYFSLINIRPKAGLGSALAQRKETTGELVGSHLTLDVTAGGITLLLVAATVPILYQVSHSWDVVWVVLALAAVGISDSFMGTAWVLLDKDLHFGITSAVSSLAFILANLPAFFIALHGGGYWSLVAQTASYSLLLVVGMWWMARQRLSYIWQLHWRFDRGVAMTLLRFGGVVGLASLAGLLVSQFDNFLVGTFVNLTTLGLYVRAYSLAQWPTQLVSGVISRASFYTYARLQDDRVRLQKTVSMSLWLITTLALPMALGIFIAAPDIIQQLYGERWLPSSIFLRFLVAYSVLWPLMSDANALFVAVGRPRLTVQIAVAQAITLMVVGTPLTLRFGAIGTCIAVGVSFIAGLGLSYGYTLRVVTLHLWNTLGLPAVATLTTLLVYVLLTHFVAMDGWLLIIRLVFKLIATTAVYFGCIFALQWREMTGRTAYLWQLIRAPGSAP